MDIRAVWDGMGVRSEDVVAVDPREIDWVRIASEIPNDVSYEARLGVAFAITSMSQAKGECRLNGLADLEQLFPVLDNDGLHWECTHVDPHVSEKVVGLGP